MNNIFKKVNNLNYENLNDIFNDKICVLWVKNYASPQVCDQLHTMLMKQTLHHYDHEVRMGDKLELFYYGVNRFGYSLNSTYTDQTGEKLDTYFKAAPKTMTDIRKASSPYISPIDKLRVDLDEIWPNGANVAIINGKKAFVGIGRVMPADLSHLSEKQPHFDLVDRKYFPNLSRQYAANIYLNVPGNGGELEIWNVNPIMINEVNTFKPPEDWRSELPPSFKIKPAEGDLLIFNSCRPHAVTRFEGDVPRTSIQSFLGLTQDLKILLWN